MKLRARPRRARNSAGLTRSGAGGISSRFPGIGIWSLQMAVINSLAFDRNSGAVVADEEYWFLRRRKSFFADSIHALMPDEAAQELGMEAVYGGVGYPSFHCEVVQSARKELSRIWSEWKEKGEKTPPFDTVEAVGRKVVEAIQKTIRRRVDEKLRFYYGFGTDDFIKGTFTADGKKHDIKQEKVKGYAKAVIEYTEKSPMIKTIYDNVSMIMGYDRKRGLSQYHVKAENCVLSLVSGRFESIGKGKYASAMVLTHFLGNKTLAERIEGIDPVDGVVELIKATLSAHEYFQEAGGGMNMTLVDGSMKKREDRIRTVADNEMKLASETVRALGAGLIARKDALGIVDRLVFQGASADQCEDMLFKAAKDGKRLEFLLRGYKVQDWNEAGFGLPGPAGRKSRPKARG